MKISIFSGRFSQNDKYNRDAYILGQSLAKNGHIIVNGGGLGLMEKVCSGAKNSGGCTIGICLEGEETNQYLDKKEVKKDLTSRQKRLLEIADAYLALPGGIATFYEIFGVLREKIYRANPKTFIIFGDYFNKLKNNLCFMQTEGFIKINIKDYVYFTNSVQKVCKILS